MTKIFYTKYEGGSILIKTIFSRRGFVNLLNDIEDASHGITGGSDFIHFRTHIKLFGINIHSVFIPVGINYYHRWDSINGWTPELDYSYNTYFLKTLTKEVNRNK